MRTTFVRTLTALAEKDPSIMLLTGDLGFTVLEDFRDRLPLHYLNAGVAEQNMIGTAAGLAMCGKRVFVYSIIPFVTFRCLEHIRNDICYHNLPVTIVGVGGGYSYGHMGPTHHAIEDIAVLRSLPNMTVVCPGDPVEVECAVRALAKLPGPAYLRLGKAGEPQLHAPSVNFQLGKAITMQKGNDITIIATGNMLETAVTVGKELQKSDMNARVASMHTVKPIDDEYLTRAATETRLIVTLEEHSCIGGLGSAVAESLAGIDKRCPHLLLSAPDSFATTVGSQQYLREAAGLSIPQIVEQIQRVMVSTVEP